jgi:RNA polymerase sigma factor (sigma-70 family)
VNQHIGNNPADKQLIEWVLHGNTRAFGIIIKNTENLVAQVVFKMIPVAEDRKDLAQDIYLRVFHNLAGFKFQSKLSTWIAQIAYNACLSWIEKKKPVLTGTMKEEDLHPGSKESFAFSNEPERRLTQKELGGILQKEIDLLPAIYQTLITLFHQESMSYDELSQITGLPSGTVKSSLFRARKMLKENLLSKYQKEAL